MGREEKMDVRSSGGRTARGPCDAGQAGKACCGMSADVG